MPELDQLLNAKSCSCRGFVFVRIIVVFLLVVVVIT